jgi:hypothetical protein
MEKYGSMYCRHEYRINKKGAECFRSDSFEVTRDKLAELQAKRPGVYTMQSRSCRCNKVGTMETIGGGNCSPAAWSPWR